MKKNPLTQLQLDIRQHIIVEAKRKGLSLREISQLFNFPISKARVHQIIEAAK